MHEPGQPCRAGICMVMSATSHQREDMMRRYVENICKHKVKLPINLLCVLRYN